MTKLIFSFVLLIIILMTAFFLPKFVVDFDVSVVLTALSLLFAIMAGFFIAAATSNHLRLQTLIADEDSALIEIYDIAKIIEPSIEEELGEAIDTYMIASLDYDLLNYAPNTSKELGGIVEVIDKVTPKNEKGWSLFQTLHERKNSLFTITQEVRLSAKTIVGKRHWLILVLLAVLISILLLTLRTDSFVSILFITAIIYSTFQILILINEIDINLLLAHKLAFENPQQVFEKIGRPHYYPEYAITNGSAKPKESIFRVGKYIDRPRSYKKEIVVING